MKAPGWAAAIASVPLMLCTAGLLVAASDDTVDVGCATTAASGQVNIRNHVGAVGNWSSTAVDNATIIVTVGQQKRVPARGWVIAVATAMTESRLVNSSKVTDHDSVGLFQQRPSQGWGTPAQLIDPVYTAGKFYDALVKVKNWDNLPLTVAAQRVQRSAFPDRYAAFESDATLLVQRSAAGSKMALPSSIVQCADPCPSTTANDTGTGGRSASAATDCSNLALGAADPVRRNADGSWPTERCSIRPDPTTGDGCVTPRLHHLVQQATAAGFPRPGCYRPSDHGEHPKGRACDFMMTPGEKATDAQKARGDRMAAWAVSNANRLGIMYVIWFRRIWTNDGRGWHAYDNKYGGNTSNGWHTNHVHISVY
ncbi:hypothetical protein ACTOB_003670 [Actinoplanes oblitus]|uniref:ARB-07466-like C-terminal domain-containing protein n=1 Tax=Actinoplanes oblitus TaxID=3040509 RepID=A0ABY8WQ43_9ACTN|nr:hypothetical protein [Actinoplanes oblitus]WIM99996.1 hypothetical protein ACTOB_003670 [Actinoplanes oblitus]